MRLTVEFMNISGSTLNTKANQRVKIEHGFFFVLTHVKTHTSLNYPATVINKTNAALTVAQFKPCFPTAVISFIYA